MIELFLYAFLLYDQCFEAVFLGFLNDFKIEEAESTLNTFYCVLALLDLLLEHLTHKLAFPFGGRLPQRSLAAVGTTNRVAIEHQLALLF